MTHSNLPDFNDIVDSLVEQANDPIPTVDPAEVHAAAAQELQTLADAAVDSGDYATAAVIREAAEIEAYEAGDNSMLHGSDSTDLETAAQSQSDAQWYADRQAEAIASGDYQAAQDYAWSAAESLKDADFAASGDDHSAQATADHYELGLAVEQEAEAQWYVEQADSWAEAGAYDTAETYLAEAVEHQASADDHAAFAIPDPSGWNSDPSSNVETFSVTDFSISTDVSSVDMTAYDVSSFDTTAYDSSTCDASSYDAGSYDSSSYDSSSYDSSSYDA